MPTLNIYFFPILIAYSDTVNHFWHVESNSVEYGHSIHGGVTKPRYTFNIITNILYSNGIQSAEIMFKMIVYIWCYIICYYLRLNSALGQITTAGERVSNDWTMVTLVLKLLYWYFCRHSKLLHTVKVRPIQKTMGLKYRSVRILRLSVDGDMFDCCTHAIACQLMKLFKLSLHVFDSNRFSNIFSLVNCQCLYLNSDILSTTLNLNHASLH